MNRGEVKKVIDRVSSVSGSIMLGEIALLVVYAVIGVVMDWPPFNHKPAGESGVWVVLVLIAYVPVLVSALSAAVSTVLSWTLRKNTTQKI